MNSSRHSGESRNLVTLAKLYEIPASAGMME
jgi:hypothetical protein